MSERLPFKAHVRLLTMLGEQLIKNERIALVELVKNSYDADATVVEVDFRGFGPDFATSSTARIVLTDNGTGMTPEIIQTAWMNPATPSKAVIKKETPRTALGRVLQGEKGIGRFATFKLGNVVSLTTRAMGRADEATLLIDISEIDESDESPGQRTDYYLDQLLALYDENEPTVFTGRGAASSHGTRLEIAGLRADWSSRMFEAAFTDLDRLQPQLWGADIPAANTDFVVRFLKDGQDQALGVRRSEEFQAILDRAVLRVSGQFSALERRFEFQVNQRQHFLPLDGAEARGIKVFREHFKDRSGDIWREPECGPFGFEFFIFDFSSNAPGQFSLDRQEKAMLKEHRIYLYRDGIRVYPYGDPDDDWLGIDAIRGTQSARSIFSNDQVVGFVTITQDGNPRLRDKTNREGLLESGRATQDFVALLQSVLAFLRAKPYEQYAAENRRTRERKLRGRKIDDHISQLRRLDLPKSASAHLDDLEAALSDERELAATRIARTEQLAGVGMSVESASHDLIAAGAEALRVARNLVGELRMMDLMDQPIFAVAKSLVMRLEFINSRFKDVQGLFVSTRQKRTLLDVAQLVRRVRAIYGALHEHENITFELDDPFTIRAVSTEAAVLQCLINLVDNATYWLTTSPHRPRLIRAFTVDGDTLAITDNGPGVGSQDAEFIFEPFYSGKADDGKGLGLYIARENGLRSGFTVDLAQSHDVRMLSGATFLVSFEESG